jgi:hypothetical protein
MGLLGFLDNKIGKAMGNAHVRSLTKDAIKYILARHHSHEIHLKAQLHILDTIDVLIQEDHLQKFFYKKQIENKDEAYKKIVKYITFWVLHRLGRDLDSEEYSEIKNVFNNYSHHFRI